MSEIKLAVHGGEQVRTKAWPTRGHVGVEEKAAVDALFDATIKSGNPIGYGGEQEDAYCKEFADYLGGGYCDGVSSGTGAVYVALRALELPAHSEVIIGACTDTGPVMALPLLNLIPMIADLEPDSYNTNAEQIEALITERTSAIIIAHIFGEPSEMDSIVALAEKHNLPLIEDCAQSHGAAYKGQMLGSFGAISTFSTMMGKHHCTGGHGGLVFTKDADLYQKIRWASDRGKPFGVEREGASNQIAALNFNQDEMGCAMGREQLKKLPKIVEDRRVVASKLAVALNSVESLDVPVLSEDAHCSYWFVRMHINTENLTCDNDTYKDALVAEGLPMLPNYSKGLPHQGEWFENRRVFGKDDGLPWSSPLYKGDKDKKFPCPNAAAVNEVHFALIFCETWGDEEIADVVEMARRIETFYAK